MFVLFCGWLSSLFFRRCKMPSPTLLPTPPRFWCTRKFWSNLEQFWTETIFCLHISLILFVIHILLPPVTRLKCLEMCLKRFLHFAYLFSIMFSLLPPCILELFGRPLFFRGGALLTMFSQNMRWSTSFSSFLLVLFSFLFVCVWEKLVDPKFQAKFGLKNRKPSPRKKKNSRPEPDMEEFIPIFQI